MINHISFPPLGLEIDVSRSLFSVFGIDIYTYGVLIALGLGLAFVYAMHEAGKTGLAQDDLLNMFIIAVPVSIVCARLYYVVFSWGDYKNNPIEVFNIRGGGLAIYGGIIGALVSVFLYCRKKKIPLGKVLDILAVGLLIGQAIGRWGNFVNGEAFGADCDMPWAMTIVQDGRTIAELCHPTFLYESLWNVAGIAALTAYKRMKRTEGELFCAYMVWYGFGRMLIEGLRTDSLYIGAFRVSQLLAAASAILGAVLIFWLRKKQKKTGV